MISFCNELPAFHAGELDDVRAQAMRRHIGHCARCQRELGQIILEETVTHPEGRAAQPAPAIPVSLRRNRTSRLAGAALLAVAAAALVLIVRGRDTPREPEIALTAALAGGRAVEMRLAGADAHRPYEVQRASSSGEEIPLAVLAELERRRDGSALFAAHLLRGDLDAAERALAIEPDGPDRDSDRAALDLAARRPDAAASHAAAALARSPRLGRALWNAALAHQQLGLDLGAAALFDRVAALDEPGWAPEARASADRLRQAWKQEQQTWQRARGEADALERDLTPMSADSARRQPDLARRTLLEALRGAAPAGAARLVEMADAVDRAQETGSLGRAARQAASPARGRASLAAAYAALRSDEKATAPGWRALARRAAAAGHADIELGALAQAAGRDPSVYAELDEKARATADPWLRAWTAMEHAYQLIYAERRFAAAQLLLLEVLQVCPGARMPARCALLDGLLAAALAVQGRHDLARGRIERAFEVAAAAEDSGVDRLLLSIAAEVAAGRDPEAADPVALAAAFREESLLRQPDCEQHVYGLDYLTMAALDLNRVDEARAFAAQADLLLRGRCRAVGPRTNGATARARLLQHGGDADQIARVRADVAALRAERGAGERALLDLAEGRLIIERNLEQGEALLRRAIAAGAGGEDTLAAAARDQSFAVLALDAGRRGDFGRALAVVMEAQGRAAGSGCVLGVAGEDRLLVVARGRDDRVHGSHRSLPAGRTITAEEIVPPALRASLAGCPVVDVHALGAYYGLAGVLPRELAWRYRSPAGRAGAATGGARLVVTDVEPPAWLKLPALRDGGDQAGAVTVRGGAATPRRVLAEMRDAAVIEIHAHGQVDVNEPSVASLALSPDADGDYALTADRVRGAELSRHPLVLLAACHAGRTPRGDRRWGLADAFLAAGARSVVASTGVVPDADLSGSLALITAGVAAGRSPAEAVRDVRVAHPTRAWLNYIVVFE